MLFRYVPLEHLTPHHRAVHIALRVHPKALGDGVIWCGRLHVLDEGKHLAVAGAADADALADAHQLVGAGIGAGFGIGHSSLIHFSNSPLCCGRVALINANSAAANSSPWLLSGNRWPYVSAVMAIVEWPRRDCTIFSGNSWPPSALRLMHQLA